MLFKLFDLLFVWNKFSFSLIVFIEYYVLQKYHYVICNNHSYNSIKVIWIPYEKFATRWYSKIWFWNNKTVGIFPYLLFHTRSHLVKVPLVSMNGTHMQLEALSNEPVRPWNVSSKGESSKQTTVLCMKIPYCILKKRKRWKNDWRHKKS